MSGRFGVASDQERRARLHPFADVGKNFRFMIAMQHVGQTRAEMGSGIRCRLYNRLKSDLPRNAAVPFAFR